MTHRVPMTWGSGRERVHLPYLLIESDDPALAVSDFTAFVQAGFNPAFCGGPAAGQPCPVLDGGRCDLIDEADVVLRRMGHGSGISDAVRRSRPELPVVVVGAGPNADLPPSASLGRQTDALRHSIQQGGTWRRSVGALGFSR